MYILKFDSRFTPAVYKILQNAGIYVEGLEITPLKKEPDKCWLKFNPESDWGFDSNAEFESEKRKIKTALKRAGF
jgi:hypothetical protein